MTVAEFHSSRRQYAQQRNIVFGCFVVVVFLSACKGSSRGKRKCISLGRCRGKRDIWARQKDTLKDRQDGGEAARQPSGAERRKRGGHICSLP